MTGKFETDSRNVNQGDIFVCRQGLCFDSHDFIDDAAQKGAVGFITSKKINGNQPCIKTPGFPVSVSLINRFYKYPQDKMINIGITGTNGKTTVAYCLQQLLNRHFNAAYTGTLGCMFEGFHSSLMNTTPDAITLLNLMAKMNRAGVTHHVMEVSSHALDQDRVSMIDFDIIIFTNLGQDHLDYHGNYDEYVQSKLRLVDRLKPGGTAIINRDDATAPAILDRCRGKAETITFGIQSEQVNIRATHVTSSYQGGSFSVECNGEIFPVKTPLPFSFNVENSLMILAALNLIHKNLTKAADLLTHVQPPPGRGEVINLPNGATIIIDYAHNHNSLENLLDNTRQHCTGKIYTVIGVTGERLADAESIGALCAQRSDKVYFTCDNPLGVSLLRLLQAMCKKSRTQPLCY